MIQIKIFSDVSYSKLEDDVNEWLEREVTRDDIVSISFKALPNSSKHYVLVTYQVL